MYVKHMQKAELNPTLLLQHDDRFGPASGGVGAVYEVVLRKLGIQLVDNIADESSQLDKMLFSIIQESNAESSPEDSWHNDWKHSARENTTNDTARPSADAQERTLDDMAAIKVTESAGVRFMASTLSRIVAKSASKEGMSMYDRQSWLEDECKLLGMDQFAAKTEGIPESARAVASVRNKMITSWVAGMEELITHEIQAPSEKAQPYAIYLASIPPRQLAVITIALFLRVPSRKLILKGQVVGEHFTSSLLQSIGHHVGAEAFAMMVKRHKSSKEVHTGID